MNGDMLKTKIAIFAVSLFAIAIVGCSEGEEQNGSEFPIRIEDRSIDSGRSVYENSCASCHGPVNGPTTLKSAPVHGDAGHTWHHPDRLLFDWVMDRPPLATSMPAFRGQLSEAQVLDVLAYIKTFWRSDILKNQLEGSAQYEAQVAELGVN